MRYFFIFPRQSLLIFSVLTSFFLNLTFSRQIKSLFIFGALTRFSWCSTFLSISRKLIISKRITLEFYHKRKEKYGIFTEFSELWSDFIEFPSFEPSYISQRLSKIWLNGNEFSIELDLSVEFNGDNEDESSKIPRKFFAKSNLEFPWRSLGQVHPSISTNNLALTQITPRHTSK